MGRFSPMFGGPPDIRAPSAAERLVLFFYISKGRGLRDVNYKTAAEARTITPDGAKVFCSYDEIVAIKDLIPNPGNPNKHPQRQLEILGEIIAANGWRAPITVSRRSGLMVKGHGRRMAALFQNLEWAPVEYQNYTSEAEEHADLIADNRIAELAELDTEKLVDMLQDLDTGEMPLELSGFTTEDLERILNAINGADDVSDDKADAEPGVADETEAPKVSRATFGTWAATVCCAAVQRTRRTSTG